MAYSGYMIDVLKEYKNSSYNSMANTTADKINDIMSNECASIEEYANEISKLEYPSVDTYIVRAYLGNLVRYNGYSNMYIVNNQGEGFDYLNNSIDVSNSQYFNNIDYTNQSIVYQDGKMLYITPTIDESNQFKFFIIAELPSVISKDKILIQNWNDMGFYILDENKNIIAYSENANPNLEYSQLNTQDNRIYSPNDDTTNVNFKKFITSVSSIFKPPNTYPTMWYENSIGFNDWTIIMGRSASNDDGEFKALLSISMDLINIIVLTLILMIIVFVIRNARANYKLAS